MKNKFKYFVILFILVFIQGSKFVIDPVTNAVLHNENGLKMLRDGYYTAAISEFKLAIALNPNTAVTATFYNNLGNTYLKIRKYGWAVFCFNKAININPNFLEYYQNLVNAYKAQNLVTSEINRHFAKLKKNQSDATSWLILGLLYKELNYNYDAILCLKEFKKLEPDLILTREVDDMINGLIKK